MIKELTRKTIFAPRRLINEMVRWILGVHSSEGTIRVANTATPGEERSLDVNVDMDAMKAHSDEWAASRGLSDVQREETANVMRQHLDGMTLVWQNDLAAVNADWLDARLENLKSDGSDGDGAATTSYTSVTSGGSAKTVNNKDAWVSGGENGAKVSVCTLGYAKDDTNVHLKWRTLTISADGRITNISAESSGIVVYPGV